jgi:DNA-binding CsgD family transcriptional regulator
MIRNLKVLGFVALSQGDYDRAVDHLARATELEERARYGDPSIFRLSPELIEALIGVGNLHQAEVLVRELEDIGTNLDHPWARVTGARCRGFLVAALGDLSTAMEALERAIAEHDRLPQPFELGRTWMAIGMVQRRGKRKRPAREALERAVTIFETLGARLWVERARGELSRIGGRAPSPLALTPTEERVVQLAANGLTNREIAEQLFISVRTVESHLTKIFQKTGVTSRRELRRRGRTSPGSGES